VEEARSESAQGHAPEIIKLRPELRKALKKNDVRVQVNDRSEVRQEVGEKEAEGCTGTE
jgi:hypothetical protein